MLKQVFCVANNFSSSETESDTSILVYVSKEGTTQNKDIMSKKKKKKKKREIEKKREEIGRQGMQQATAERTTF